MKEFEIRKGNKQFIVVCFEETITVYNSKSEAT